MKWIKKMENELVIADMKDPNYVKKLEQSIFHGKKVLLQDVGDELDPVLDNVLNKSLVTTGKISTVKIGEKEIEWHKNFKLYITTRFSNPHYTPEVSTKVTVVNFQVKQDGLEDQCLEIVVRSEQPEVEAKRGEQVQKIEEYTQKKIDLEDEILQLLQDVKPELILEDVKLIDTLNVAKETSNEVKEILAAAA
jgi:dynein heavy chain